MFPRLSLLYRITAICILLTFAMVVFHTRLSYHVKSHMNSLGKSEQFSLGDGFIMIETVRSGRNYFSPLNTPEKIRSVIQNGSKPEVKLSTQSLVTSMISSEPVVNPHDFNFIINPTKLCDKTGLRFLIYVHTAPKNFRKRQLVRQTWGSKAILVQYNMRVVFIMGRVADNKTMDAVVMESNRYGDVVMEDFFDSYRNLTYKAVAALKWTSIYCNHTPYVLKADDDILIDIHALMDYLNSEEVRNYGTRNLIICNQWTRMKVIRDKKSKWYVSPTEYPDDFFSPYCSGSAFVMSADVVKSMYKASFYVPFFWVDDFYVTGMLVKRINAQHKRLNDGYILNSKVALEKLTGDSAHVLKFFHVNKMNHIYKMWKILGKRLNKSCDYCFTWSQTTSSPHKS